MEGYNTGNSRKGVLGLKFYKCRVAIILPYIVMHFYISPRMHIAARPNKSNAYKQHFLNAT